MGKRPKLGRTSAQDKLYDWVLRQYFDYIDEKDRLGGFPLEGELRAVSSVKFAPEVEPGTLRDELVRQFWRAIWTIDPVRRPAEEKEEKADGAESQQGTETSGRADGDGSDDATSSPRYEEEWDLFSVAGISMPASFTVPDANVPGGYRRVGRRFGTLRIYDLHVGVEESKAEQQTSHAKRSRENYAKVSAAVGGSARFDVLLWELRDGKVVPPPRPRPRPSA